jgi:hypothetical protein
MASLGVLAALGLLVASSLLTDVGADHAIAVLPLVLVSAGGLVDLGARAMRTGLDAWFARIATIVLAVGVLPSTVSHLMDGTRFDQRPAFARIERERPDLLVLTAPAIVQRAYAPRLRAHELSANTVRLDSLMAMERDLWVVSANTEDGPTVENGEELAGWLRDHCRLADVRERRRLDHRRHRVELWRCTRPRPA